MYKGSHLFCDVVRSPVEREREWGQGAGENEGFKQMSQPVIENRNLPRCRLGMYNDAISGENQSLTKTAVNSSSKS